MIEQVSETRDGKNHYAVEAEKFEDTYEPVPS